MALELRIYGLFLLSCLLMTSEQAQAQVSQAGIANPTTTDLSTPAMKYFGRGIRLPVARPQIRRQALPAQRYQFQGGKPFQNVYRGPTVTPYLQLDTIESSVGMPNYYSRVLPQIQQEQAIQSQTIQLRRLQQQIRLANTTGGMINSRNGGVPTTGHSSQFLNVGGYFPTVK